MPFAQILNLSNPRLVAAVAVVCVAVVAISLKSLSYHPEAWDACEGVTAAMEDVPAEAAAEEYLKRSRDWSRADYCIDRIWTKGSERIVSVRHRGKVIGGGEGFQMRLDPATMTVKGELPHE